jgi:hypothetical protein
MRRGFYVRRTHPEGTEFLALRWVQILRYLSASEAPIPGFFNRDPIKIEAQAAFPLLCERVPRTPICQASGDAPVLA